MVSFFYMLPKKSEYRIFQIKSLKNEKANDFQSIEEVIYRRYKNYHNNALEKVNLILIDGGKGQVNKAYEVLKSLKLDIPIIGLAKKNEEIIFPYTKESLILDRSSITLKFLQNIRDEAHRFAHLNHKKAFLKKSFESIFRQIKGIGIQKEKHLLKEYKNIKQIKNLSIEELSNIKGISQKDAKIIYQFFQKKSII